jgi:hypothetical protein
MAVVKIIEVIGESSKSWEDAVQEAVKEAALTVRGIKNVWVQDFKAVVDGDKIVRYRANCKLSFMIEHSAPKKKGK